MALKPDIEKLKKAIDEIQEIDPRVLEIAVQANYGDAITYLLNKDSPISVECLQTAIMQNQHDSLEKMLKKLEQSKGNEEIRSNYVSVLRTAFACSLHTINDDKISDDCKIVLEKLDSFFKIKTVIEELKRDKSPLPLDKMVILEQWKKMPMHNWKL